MREAAAQQNSSGAALSKSLKLRYDSSRLPDHQISAMIQACNHQLRALGNSDLSLSALGLGSLALGGGDWEYSAGHQDDNHSIAAIHCAIDHGINWIDTAAIYGFGHAEEVVARAVKSASRKPYIFTKCSLLWRPDGSHYNSLRASSLAEELEGSLRRLQVETIDLYQVHWPLPDNELEEGWEALERFRDQGKIRWIGASNFSVAHMKRAMRIAPITSLQPAYCLLRRRIENDVLPFAQANGIGVINYSPMATGLLSGKMTRESVAALPDNDWRLKNNQYHEPRLSHALRLVEFLRKIGDSHGVSPGIVAIAWTLHHPAITGTIVGGRSAKQVEELAPALHFRLSQEEYEQIGRFLNSPRWLLSKIYCRIAPKSWHNAHRS